jgi:hypothetical protein
MRKNHPRGIQIHDRFRICDARAVDFQHICLTMRYPTVDGNTVFLYRLRQQSLRLVLTYMTFFCSGKRFGQLSARAVAVIRPATSIIALPLFLCTLSGKSQLHASRY